MTMRVNIAPAPRILIEAVKLLQCVARQPKLTYGCFDLPGNWSWTARWTASESLSPNFESQGDWRSVYQRAAAYLRSTVRV